jgi:hypothetical protein
VFCCTTREGLIPVRKLTLNLDQLMMAGHSEIQG